MLSIQKVLGHDAGRGSALISRNLEIKDRLAV